jgi:hypothetical protein
MIVLTVWAVTYGNYDPPEVLALYDNQPAAQAHAADQGPGAWLPYGIVPMQVRSSYRPQEADA